MMTNKTALVILDLDDTLLDTTHQIIYPLYEEWFTQISNILTSDEVPKFKAKIFTLHESKPDEIDDWIKIEYPEYHAKILNAFYQLRVQDFTHALWLDEAVRHSLAEIRSFCTTILVTQGNVLLQQKKDKCFVTF